MLIKDYQVEISNKKFQEYKSFFLSDDRLLITTTSYIQKYETLNHFVTSTKDQHHSYIYKEGTIKYLQGLKIEDIYNSNSKRYELQSKPIVSQNMICSPSGFRTKYRDYLKVENIYFEEDTDSSSYFLNQTLLLTADRQKKCLFVKDLTQKTNHQKQGFFFDLNLDRRQSLQTLTVLNSQQCLILVDDLSSLVKYDIEEKDSFWSIKMPRFETFDSYPVLLSQKSFMIGCNNIEDNISSLQLFDFRVKGPVVKLLQSNSHDILRQSINRNLSANFNMMAPLSTLFSFFSILSYQGGRKSLPYWFDIRKPDSFNYIQLQNKDYLTHVKGVHSHKGKLYVIEREFNEYRFKRAKVSEYKIDL